MIGKQIITGTLFTLLILTWGEATWASFDVLSNETVHLEIKGYDGLNGITLFRGELAPGIKQNVATSYRGLALLLFAQGQVYPVIVGNQPFLLMISNPSAQPSFTGSEENAYLYARLNSAETGPARYKFPDLMIKAKELLDSTGSVNTVDGLQAMEERFHAFVRSHYQGLSHSDMIRRLIAQYFMMHEYVDYHVPGTPATGIRVRYEQAIMDGVQNWLDLLKTHIPPHEILNYCVSIYYDRSMVTFAWRIMENFRDAAYCPGKEKLNPVLPPSLSLTDGQGQQKKLQELTGKKMIAFVSDDCTVSKVKTVVKARNLQPGTTIIVVPLQPLSEKHLVLQRMVSGGNMMFVDDEKWRKTNVPEDVKLPRFSPMEEKTF